MGVLYLFVSTNLFRIQEWKTTQNREWLTNVTLKSVMPSHHLNEDKFNKIFLTFIATNKGFFPQLKMVFAVNIPCTMGNSLYFMVSNNFSLVSSPSSVCFVSFSSSSSSSEEKCKTSIIHSYSASTLRATLGPAFTLIPAPGNEKKPGLGRVKSLSKRTGIFKVCIPDVSVPLYCWLVFRRNSSSDEQMLVKLKVQSITCECFNSPVILWRNFGQPATNCNRRYFNGFRLRNLSLITYQKSQEIPWEEVAKKRDLLRSSENRFTTAWEGGWLMHFFMTRV